MIKGAAVKTRDAFRLSGRNWATIISLFVALGFVTLIFTVPTKEPYKILVLMFLALSLMFIGAFLGFLFGIPKSLQGDPAISSATNINGNKEELRHVYTANTNLEQISDWLTKILVGVGLTQISSIPEGAHRFGEYFGPSVGGVDTGSRLSVVVAIFFSTSGFLFTYIWTRLFLGGELARADLSSQVRNVVEAQNNQNSIDAKALSLTIQWLNGDDPDQINPSELKKSIIEATAPIKVQIFYAAQDQRSKSWQDQSNRWKISKTIPIFEALAESDKNKRFHQNYAELGFALKDKVDPDFSKAERALTEAINIRGDVKERGHEIYEFNRAICRINLDQQYKINQKSNKENYDKITSDLRDISQFIPDFHNEPTIINWLRINGISDINKT